MRGEGCRIHTLTCHSRISILIYRINLYISTRVSHIILIYYSTVVILCNTRIPYIFRHFTINTSTIMLKILALAAFIAIGARAEELAVTACPCNGKPDCPCWTKATVVDKIPEPPAEPCGCKKEVTPCPCEKEETKPATIVESVKPACPCKKEEPKCGCEEATKPALIKKPCEKTNDEPCPQLHEPEIVDKLPCDETTGDENVQITAEGSRFRALRSNGKKKVKCNSKRL